VSRGVGGEEKKGERRCRGHVLRSARSELKVGRVNYLLCRKKRGKKKGGGKKAVRSFPLSAEGAKFFRKKKGLFSRNDSFRDSGKKRGKKKSLSRQGVDLGEEGIVEGKRRPWTASAAVGKALWLKWERRAFGSPAREARKKSVR